MLENYKNIYYLHFDTIDSTSQWTRNNAHTLEQTQLTCVTAMEQTSGRGRWSRKWVSPRGQNIYATLYFCLKPDCQYLANLGQILSLSCSTVLKEKGFHPQIKWPNDLLLERKKVAGILCETVNFPDRIGIVLSIGININMTQELLDTIDQPATSLAQLSGHPWTLEQILEPLVQQFLKDLKAVETQGFKIFVPAYEALLAYKGQQITCHDGKNSIQGICESIDNEGRLNLKLDDGRVVKISAGEILF
jgi:BirA family biotin operon repressor/biotin-[acetyl-CoA-carboxylase] ligase